MILYFADRRLNILGQASTNLPKGLTVTNDLKTEDVESGVSIFECDILFDEDTKTKVEEWANVGNYILRSSDNENEVYTIVDAEIDTKKQKVYIYAEDDGLDLLNVVVGQYEASGYYPIEYYLGIYADDVAGWEIGINEVKGLTRKLSFDSEQTASARLLSIAEAFNNAEISYSFEIHGLQIVKKYINIYEKRGKDTGVQLRLNKEIDSIVTTKTITNLATALRATGGTPENSETPVTLLGYEYDDGNFYVDGAVLKSRNALKAWERYHWKNDTMQQDGGHIVKPFSYDTTSQEVLCEKAIEELKLRCDMEVNYEADIKELPDNVKIGDRVSIVDDKGNLYLSSRILVLETSVTDRTRKAILGEHLIKKSGISQKVEELAEQFAKSTKSVERAKVIAENAKELAENAKTQAENALTESENAKTAAEEAKTESENATNSAANAQAEAKAAQAAVNKVEESVTELQEIAENAEQAIDGAMQAAQTANTKAEEAKTAAENAQEDATEAKNQANTAATAAESAVEKAETSIVQAGSAKSKADEATAIARAAKADAEQAEKDVSALGDSLDTLSRTMQTEYTRKTDLTETQADLKTEIAQNSAKIETTAKKVVKIDETANNAFGTAIEAQSLAVAAQQLADEATAAATAAQTAANEAAAAAINAQSEADTAKAAALTARNVADTAEADLNAAKAELETVLLRANATEEEIATAKEAVISAQNAADIAKADAKEAESVAIAAQNTADKAAEKAAEAQATATAAVNNANLAQANAETAKGNAEEAKAAAEEAKATAINAQTIADEARATAKFAQSTADKAVTDAENARAAAEEAESKATQAEADLEAAEQNLSKVLADVESTEEEIAAAQSAVEFAQAAADTASTEATAAQTRADEAAAYASTAQTAATEAKTAADNAQAAAEEAMQAVKVALGEVGTLEVKTITSETRITQNADEIALKATKEEVTDAVSTFKITADNISSKVEEVEATTEENEKSIVSAMSLIDQHASWIKSLVVGKNGESLMTQTEDGIFFDFATILETIEDNAKQIGKYDDRIKFGSYEGEPSIEFSESSTDFKVVITNKRILFMEGSAIPTYIFDNTLVTENIQVKEELRQGGFVWKVRANGNYGLMWKGVNE